MQQRFRTPCRRRGGISSAQRGQVQAQCRAGDVGQGAGEVVEALCLGGDGGDGDEALERVGEGDGGTEGFDSGGREIWLAE